MKASRKKANLVAQLSPWRVLALVLVLAILVQFMALMTLRQDLQQANNLIATQQSNIAAAHVGASLTKVIVSPSENLVYIPDMKLKLPLTPVTLQLGYSMRTPYQPESDTTQEADVSTTALATYAYPSQAISCRTSVRLKIEAKPNPYNPHETVRASVQLADGRTLQAYSYQHDTCDDVFSVTDTDSVAQATAFKQAQSY